jgi:hypothetical protein
MIRAYVPQDDRRVQYAFEVLLGAAGCDYALIRDRETFLASEGWRMHYTEEDIPGSLQIIPSGYLKEHAAFPEDIATGTWHDIPTLFHHNLGDTGFDLPAAVFFLISRHEEYLPFEADALGRFEAPLSFQSRRGWLGRPLVDEWRMALLRELAGRNQSVPPAPASVKGEITVDVDSAFAYRHKGWYRTLGGMAKDVKNADVGNFSRRLATLSSLRSDHYDTYAYIRSECEKANAPLRWFFLLADFGTYDRNVPHTSPALRALIRDLAACYPLGIHPGVAASGSAETLVREMHRLTELTGEPVRFSRQHYLRLTFPDTYRMLLDAGITDEYSMGYAQDTGFRLGTSLPVRWYDLKKEEATSLTLHPFCAMDTTLRKYLGLSPEQAMERLSELARTTREAGGRFSVVWHNETLSDQGIWKGWRAVFEHAVRLSAQ